MSQSDTACPHGLNCPFSHVHKRTPSAPSAHISLISSPAFSPSPPPSNSYYSTSSHLPLLSLGAIPPNPRRPAPSAVYIKSRAEGWVPTGGVDASSIRRPITPDWLTDAKPRRTRQPKHDALPKRARTPKFDSLGLPPHPLVPQFDLSHYKAFKRAHRSVGSNRSIDSVLSGAESGDGEEGSVWSARSRGRRSRGRRSRRGSLALSGKYAVPVVPPFKGSRSGTPAAVEPRDEGTVENIPEREAISTSASNQYSRPEVLYQSPPPTTLIDPSLQGRLGKPFESSSQPAFNAPPAIVDLERRVLDTTERKQLESPPITPDMADISSAVTRSRRGEEQNSQKGSW